MTEEYGNYFVFLGNFGSGKTELALHFAQEFASSGKDTALVDLDVINPYFRASERKETLAGQGIRLISQNFAMSNVEIITVTPEVYSVFVPRPGAVFFDVGGDDVGARAIGQYKSYFDRIPEEKLRVWLVVNTHRPLSSTPERICRMLEAIENCSRLQVNGLINNGNMSYESCGEDIAESYEIIRTVSQQTGLPVVMTSGEEGPMAEFTAIARDRKLDPAYIGMPVILHTQMHRDWQRFVKLGF